MKDPKFQDTLITNAGVLRCCLEGVATEYHDRMDSVVPLGRVSSCIHCKRDFRLEARKLDGKVLPYWLPIDFINEGKYDLETPQ